MIFNSIEFFIFFYFVFFIYWFFLNKKTKKQNLLLLLSSIFFYGFWDIRLLFLLVSLIALNFYSAKRIWIISSSRLKNQLFGLVVSLNLLVLGVFKYFNFFIDSMNQLFTKLNFGANFNSLNIILPIGISFYTFHGISYIIDVKKGKINPENSCTNYALFVGYFPLLVAGPIERATHLLPQINKERSFNSLKIISGFKQILWGLFKKVVIADTCATFANDVFNNYTDYSSPYLIIGSILFSIQIYGDFSGYTDIALGVSRCLGIELITNFRFPYFSKNIHEFWKRWHISLTSWFRDYLYFPLGGNRKGKLRTIINTWIVFLISGLWHGANWTFVFWGGLNALLLTPSLVFSKIKLNENKILNSFRMVYTFSLITILWVFFRSNNINEAFSILKSIFGNFNLKNTVLGILEFIRFKIGIFYFLLILLTFLLEWAHRKSEFGLTLYFVKNQIMRWMIYLFLMFLILINMGEKSEFIYFQF
jgi:alginate O-acetyltransferase complex protein AlgI